MFRNLLNWIREAWNKMIGPNSIKSALNIDVELSSEMTTALELWSRMYQNDASWLTTEVVSLNLPAAISSELARSATIEMAMDVTGSARADYLDEQIASVITSMREQLEYGCAKGGLVMKPYISGDEIKVDFVQADQFFPVSFDASKRMTACIFSDQRKIGAHYYTRLEYHSFEAPNYFIVNKVYRTSTKDTLGAEVPITEVDIWADIQPEATLGPVTAPLFAYFSYPMSNNVDPTSPLGISCFSRATNLIEQADIQWSDFRWEFESGKRALYVDVLAFDKDSNGKPILPHKRLYRTLNDGTNNIGDDGMFEEWSPDLRETNMLTGLDAILKRIEYTCGLAYGTLSDPNFVAKTATEIQSSKQRSAATVKDIQKALEQALNDLLYAMDVWTSLGKLAAKGAYQAVYTFDDSLVIDSDEQNAKDRMSVSLGVMPKWVYLMRNYKMEEKAAKKWIAEAKKEAPETSPFDGI